MTFTATDDGVGPLSDSEIVTITVNEVNDAPVLDPIGAKSVNEETLLSFTVTAGDPDDVPANTVTLSATGLPSGASFIPATGVFSWTPTESQQGSYNVTFTATDDGVGPLSDLEVVTITVNEVNDAPVLDPIGTQSVNEQTLLSFTVTAGDPNDDPANNVTLSATGLPAGASFIPATGVFSWTPTEVQQGSYNVTFTATDDGVGPLGDFEVVTITVNEVNDAPVLSAIGAQSVNEGGTLSIVLSAADVDAGDILSFGVAGLPAFASFTDNGDRTGTISFDPSFTDSGSYSLTVSVTDNGAPNLSDSETITLTVNPTNTAQKVQNLAADVQALIDGGGLSQKDGGKLFKRLDKAAEKLAEAKNDKVIKELEKFIKDVDKLSDKGKLDPAAAQALIDAANDAIASAAIVVPQQLSQQIIGDVQSLVDTNILSSKDGGKLIKELGKAVDEFDQNKGDKGIKNLEKFIDKVVDLMDDGDLTPAQGQPLIDAANAAIQSALPGSPLMAASAAPSQVPVEALTSSQLDLVVGQARDYWYTNGASDADMARLSQIPIYVANLPGRYLGAASPDAVWFDQDASGYGWSVDSGSPGRMDLLSAVTHEFGHVLGFEHDEASIMNSTLEVAFRHDAVAPYDGALQSEFFRDLGAQIDTRTLGIEGIHGRDETVRLEILDEAVGSIASGWPFAATERSVFSPRRLSVTGKTAGSEEEDEQTVDRELLAADNVDSVFETF